MRSIDANFEFLKFSFLKTSGNWVDTSPLGPNMLIRTDL